MHRSFRPRPYQTSRIVFNLNCRRLAIVATGQKPNSSVGLAIVAHCPCIDHRFVVLGRLGCKVLSGFGAVQCTNNYVKFAEKVIVEGFGIVEVTANGLNLQLGR